MNALTKWLIAALASVLLGSTYLLDDGPSLIDAEQDTAADVQTAQLDAQQAQRPQVQP